MVTEEYLSCEYCHHAPAAVKCSCDGEFCEQCFNLVHLRRHQKHKRAGTGATEKAWAWISGTAASLVDSASRATHFEKDEVTKWFGLHTHEQGPDRVTRLVETYRFSQLVDESLHHDKKSPRRQFPGITAFIGETGAGKSTLIRSLISNANSTSSNDDPEAPVTGAPSSSSDTGSCLSTTGEVNLYIDPKSFGTEFPHFFADCEGMRGGTPVAAQHQRGWSKHGRRYLLEPRDGKQIDRKTAVMAIYPRFLYIFSDVICMVTRNHRAWADSAVKLLEWSLVGAHNTVNQYSIPALIIVLNGPSIENERWINDENDIATGDFFRAIEEEIHENTTLRAMAKKHGDKSMRELFLRNFSSVHVHYIPLDGFRSLGNSRVIMSQVRLLAQRIRTDAKCVRDKRHESWTLFDAKQLSILFDYAFKHLAIDSDEPFDFNQCRQQISLPASAEGQFAEFLGRCMYDNVKDNFEAAASIMGSSIVRKYLKLEESELLRPAVVFNNSLKQTCDRALKQFLRNSQPCAYIHPETGGQCINTEAGHAKGHQESTGVFLAEGNFVSGPLSSKRFEELVYNTICSILREINEKTDAIRSERRHYAAQLHRSLLKSIPDQSFWQKSFEPSWMDHFNRKFGQTTGAELTVRVSVCYACLFGRPEYCLPCGHVICFDCIREFDQASPETYPGVAMHEECILCSSTDPRKGTWPYRAEYRPDLSGLRVLSLDGGGVRGIIQLSILRRLERLINLDMPFGEFFDLIVGTSAGGMIALGLGVHNFDVEECIRRFRSFCEDGLESKSLAKASYLGWAFRAFYSSIYKVEPLEQAMKKLFDGKRLFGHRDNATRVAVTTTVDSDCHLLANYNWGDGERYLNSSIETWRAARCTSAAPMYFEPVLYDGRKCRDGGLRDNNPVQTAVNEARTIWGDGTVFDMVLSVGCGKARKPQNQLSPTWILDAWLIELFSTLMKTMNGEDAWKKFRDSVTQQQILGRCHRLNIDFKDEKEPELDKVDDIAKMQELAESFYFHCQPRKGNFLPFRGDHRYDELGVLANTLKASLYFFELESMTQQEDVWIIKGWICCRLSPDRQAYRSLIEQTYGFKVKNEDMNPPDIDGGRCKLQATIHQQDSQDSLDIRIDVKFREDNLIAISGFPTTLSALKEHWKTR